MNDYPATDMASLLLDTREPNAQPSVVTDDSRDCRWEFTRLGKYASEARSSSYIPSLVVEFGLIPSNE
jgi:hypothetical protein